MTNSGSDTVNVGGLETDTVNAIDGPLTIDGGLPTTGSDILNVEDSGDSANNTGILTDTTITGLGMGGGISYVRFEDLNITLGSGSDTFNINSTHGGNTTLDAGPGNYTVNVETIEGETRVQGNFGNDTINVNALPDWPTMDNGINAVLNLDGGSGSDDVNIRLAGSGSSLINVHDTGAFDDGNRSCPA